jgi:MFS superfamily sulfate permease-like transporter
MRPAPASPVPLPRARHRTLENLRHNLPASLVVFLVAVPLSLGIAVASGAPVMSGLIAGVVGGVLAGQSAIHVGRGTSLASKPVVMLLPARVVRVGSPGPNGLRRPLSLEKS